MTMWGLYEKMDGSNDTPDCQSVPAHGWPMNNSERALLILSGLVCIGCALYGIYLAWEAWL